MTKLEWCRENAPKGLGDLSDVELLELMGSSYERFVEDKDLKFVDFIWLNYKRLSHNNELKNKQVSLLVGTGLCEPNDGMEFCFVPTLHMKKLEDEILQLYKQVNVADNVAGLCNEVFYTSKIEGANTTIKRTQMIHDGAPVDKNNLFSESMLLGSFRATKYFNIVGNKLNEEILLKAWNILTENCCANTSIKGAKYRTGNVQVGSHVGLNYLLIEDAMSLWLNYYNSSKLNSHPFIKAALLHYSFESIHPFCDGNGRIGRMLFNNFLIAKGFDKFKAISVSRSIEKDRFEYDVAFNVSDNAYGDCTYFIEYMLTQVLDALCDILNLN